jgi:C1A family cysteine protease
MPQLNIKSLAAELTRNQARWQARQTPQSNLSDEEKRRLLGVIVDEASLARAMAVTREVTEPAPQYAPEVDWRNHDGNHVTPVKDQGYCGSCVSFATTATLESMASIEKGELLDLSEADLHFCSRHGANCDGWWPHDAMEELRTRGIPDEACFPYYSAFDPPPPNPKCVVGPNRDARAVKISFSDTLALIGERKSYLSYAGPCCAVFQVFDDFYSYAGGVYHHVTGGPMGLHCVEVIGYSDAEQCWICKNSWGPGWGDGGFFKIAYGEAGIDTDFPFWTIQGVVMPSEHDWLGWDSLTGFITSKPSVTSWWIDRIELVGRGLDSAVWHRWWDGTNWLGWEYLGGQVQGAPAICSQPGGRLDVFAVGLNHRLMHKSLLGGWWSEWEDLGGMLSSDPSAVSAGPNRIDVVARGMENALWHLWWDGDGWHGWENLGGGLTSSPAVCSWGANRLDVFVRGEEMHLWHRVWNGSKWSRWEDLGGILYGDPAAVSWGENRLDVFYPGKDSHAKHRWWDGSEWSDEEDLGGQVSAGLGVSSWSRGRLDCFIQSPDSTVSHKWFS